MALAGKRTAAAGGGDATVTTVAALWAVIDSLLLTAGWTLHFDYSVGNTAWIPSTILPPFNSNYTIGALVTNSGNRYQCIQSGTAATGAGPAGQGQDIIDGTVHWRYMSSAGASDVVYTSTGEAGDQRLFVRVGYQTTSTPTALNFNFYQYFSGSFGYNRVGDFGASVPYNQFTYTAGNTINFAMVADKDSFAGITNDSANNRRVWAGGNLKRLPNVSSTFFTSNGTVTAGLNKTFTVTSGNPIAAGYLKGDRVFVVSQQTNASDPYNQVIPIYAAKITALTTSTITIDEAKETTSAGAFIGPDPQPTFYINATLNASPIANGNYVWFAYRYNTSVTNLYSAGQVNQGYPVAAAGGGSLIQSAALEADPNNRTSRVIMGENAVIDNSLEIVGLMPKYYQISRTTDALWTIGRTTKEAVPRDYVTFPTNTASPSGLRRDTVGPFATSGSAGYSIDLYNQDSNTWIEGGIYNNNTDAQVGDVLNLSVDRTFNTFMVGKDGYPVQGTIHPVEEGSLTDFDSNTFAWALYLPNIPQEIDRINRLFTTSGEPFPFDSPVAVTGGTGSAFNSGFN